MVVNLRRSRGEDIAAACGQLVKKKAEGGNLKVEGRRQNEKKRRKAEGGRRNESNYELRNLAYFVEYNEG